MADASIAQAFPSQSVEARFVVSMSMAKNDIERAIRDVIRAGKNDDPDFTYRVRLTAGHLVEAFDALNSYSQQHPAVRSLLSRVSPEGQKRLKTVRRSLQTIGPKVLQHVRDNTFHYPSPDPSYSPTSDEQLEQSSR
jgi:hypothetical protein